jgi:hypothetical protein
MSYVGPTHVRPGYKSGAAEEGDMTNKLVRRDQFKVTPQGIIHKPTDAAFSPHPGEAYSGITRMGQLGNQPNGNGFRADDVLRIMREIWIEYVRGNPQLFDDAELRRADPKAGRPKSVHGAEH